MKPGPLIFCAYAFVVGLSPPAHARQTVDGHDKSRAVETGDSEPPAPIIITRPDSHVSTDPKDTNAIEDTIGHDPTPGANQAIHCPGGQTIRQAEGDVQNVTCK